MQEQTLYLECYSGISGDMTAAALLDLGADKDVLINGLNSLHVDGFQIKISRRVKSGIDACDFDVILTDEHMHFHKQDHSHEHSHDSEHPHEHVHRNLSDIITIIEHSDITLRAKNLAGKIFQIVAEAEAKAHGLPIDEVHFHEVGALDSIADIVATAICLDNLNITRVILSELWEGQGHIHCQHGILPIPVPAVIQIASMQKLPIKITSVQGELVTPTGAAIAAAIRTENQLPSHYTIKKIGLGAGKRNYENASGLLRAILLDTDVTNTNDTSDILWKLEANLDDCTGETLGFVMECLLAAGARDVFYTPVYMKKNRPAYLLSILCSEDHIHEMEKCVFLHATTIGIRRYRVERTILPRKIITVTTPYGEGQVKVCEYENQIFYYPEYESVKSLCGKCDLSFGTIYDLLKNAAFS